MAKPGQPLSGDEVPLALQVLLENWTDEKKVAITEARRAVTKATRSKLKRKTKAGMEVRTWPTITLQVSDQVVDSVVGKPEEAVAYVLLIGISAELIDAAREARDSRIVKPNAGNIILPPGVPS